jgi:hypothetical protein
VRPLGVVVGAVRVELDLEDGQAVGRRLTGEIALELKPPSGDSVAWRA